MKLSRKFTKGEKFIGVCLAILVPIFIVQTVMKNSDSLSLPTNLQFRSLSTLSSELDALKSDVKRLKDSETEIALLTKQISTVQSKSKGLSPPNFLDTGTLLSSIGSIVSENKLQVNISYFKAGQPTSKGSYQELPYKMIVQGSYVDILDLLSRIRLKNIDYDIKSFLIREVLVYQDTGVPVSKPVNGSFSWSKGSTTGQVGLAPFLFGEELTDQSTFSGSLESLLDQESIAPSRTKKMQMDFDIIFYSAKPTEKRVDKTVPPSNVTKNQTVPTPPSTLLTPSKSVGKANPFGD